VPFLQNSALQVFEPPLLCPGGSKAPENGYRVSEEILTPGRMCDSWT
jgi:hypothetical protein